MGESDGKQHINPYIIQKNENAALAKYLRGNDGGAKYSYIARPTGHDEITKAIETLESWESVGKERKHNG